ncbi:TlpA disulfide reductase family protein [Flavobacterium saccharophilum]|uniref:Peroxiredoxin n=1 Tax=Flavobacterium saccharophilum TaxID=29534 RepID=A0A1M7FSV1_9FLAO|nr:TlpA disulfide reductase family protein [Flavobacterium saccharophilum]SHM07171.1 Peroxiredoxin [Flavobacterium saccharophilum]
MSKRVKINIKSSLFAALLAVLMISCQKEQTSYTFTGIVPGAANGTKVFLKPVTENLIMSVFSTGDITDSTEVKDGKFQFTGKLPQAKLYLVVINSKKQADDPNMPNYQASVPVFLENGEIELKATLDSIPLASNLINIGRFSFSNITVTGSKSNDIYMNYAKGLEPFAGQGDKIFNEEYLPYLNPEKGAAKQPVLKGVDIVTRMEANNDKTNAYVLDFVKNNLTNSVGLTIATQEASRFSLSELNEISSHITSELKATPLGKETALKIEELKNIAPGAQYVDLPLKDNNGNDVKLSNYLGKGKYVLLEFWASWCHPCRADIPHLKEIYELYHPKGFEIVSVSMDNDKEMWQKALKEENMPWVQISDLQAFTGNLTKTYKFRAIPTCFLIDPTGKIVTTKMRGSFMDKRLIEMYGNEFDKQK